MSEYILIKFKANGKAVTKIHCNEKHLSDGRRELARIEVCRKGQSEKIGTRRSARAESSGVFVSACAANLGTLLTAPSDTSSAARKRRACRISARSSRRSRSSFIGTATNKKTPPRAGNLSAASHLPVQGKIINIIVSQILGKVKEENHE